jgi:hypothetical protein
MARLEYCDSIRRIIHERLSKPTGNRGSDILLMFEAKAVMPEMYREEVKVLGVSGPIQMWDRLRELATKERREQEALDAPAVEGDFREVSPPIDGMPPDPAPSPPVASPMTPPEPPVNTKWTVKKRLTDLRKGNQRRQVTRR